MQNLNNNKYEYYIRKSGVIVCVKDEANLYYLNPEGEWIPNQEWFISMFVTGDDDGYTKVSEIEVENYIGNIINSTYGKKKTR